MTLQVGLVGTDGIVLGGDKQVRTRDVYVTTALVSKIKYDKAKGLVISWAADDVAETIAEKILKDFDGLDDESALQNAANRIFRKRCGRKSNARGEVLAISKACLSKVLYLEVDKLHCTTRQIEDRIFAGHTASPACYLVERYYKKAPVRGLLLLAAYTILEAGKINPVGIKGLEILTCTEEGIRRLRDDEIASLTALSESLDSQISQSLFPTARL